MIHKNEIANEVSRQRDVLFEAWEAIRIGNGRVYFNFASYKILEQRYQVGEIRREEIVEAEIELVRAQQDLVDAIAAYMIAALTLEFNAALEPGDLDLVEHRPNGGNIILVHLLTDDLSEIRNLPAPQSDQRTLREMLDKKPEESENKDERFLIEEVPLDDARN